VNIPASLNQFIFWLQSRRTVNFLLAVGYFLFILFMHDPMVQVSTTVEKYLSLPTYNLVIEVVFVLLVLLLIGTLAMRFKINYKHLKLEFTYLFVTLLLIVIHSRFMFDSNIEVIHSLEFTLLAFLIFPFTKRFGATIFFCVPFMLIDEWYQYIHLYPAGVDYFDLNDIVMDIYGCGMAMTLMMTFGIKGSENIKPLWKRPEFISLIFFVAAIIAASSLCLIAPYASDACGNTFLVINERFTPEPFLRPHPTHHILYHVMKPAEALIVIPLLVFFYFGLDSLRKPPR
jgi:hypothetical protein